MYHYFVNTYTIVLLNDLFGIQVRSGCAGAGPYVLVSETWKEIFTKFITADENGRFNGISKIELMKPGFTRFNLSYTAVWRPRAMSSENIFCHNFINPNAPHLIKNSSREDPIEEAKSMANNLPKYVYEYIDFRTDLPLNITDEYQDFIWFVLPQKKNIQF
ncbi:unnamed protein product [Rotaria sp. Silwood2]|nr:unnamed protein product [Rotaria sp. Silwood2]CAF3016550.1 unnamed protein product [Rotaria sp. Silwood2]CAF3059342.1 unnamed protein product [Rotaria sp. Silwood2]CAF3329690.1 unnamed protein product [Rotaria sp. Silwood2]CAF4139778.1 unnamed protein product [Rotaria sp. Silwood2]